MILADTPYREAVARAGAIAHQVPADTAVSWSWRSDPLHRGTLRLELLTEADRRGAPPSLSDWLHAIYQRSRTRSSPELVLSWRAES